MQYFIKTVAAAAADMFHSSNTRQIRLGPSGALPKTRIKGYEWPHCAMQVAHFAAAISMGYISQSFLILVNACLTIRSLVYRGRSHKETHKRCVLWSSLFQQKLLWYTLHCMTKNRRTLCPPSYLHLVIWCQREWQANAQLTPFRKKNKNETAPLKNLPRS